MNFPANMFRMQAVDSEWNNFYFYFISSAFQMNTRLTQSHADLWTYEVKQS